MAEAGRALRWALGWAVVFTVLHGYWYLGGRVGLGDAPSPLPGRPTTLIWVGAVILIVRGGSGLLDDAVRASGLSEGGITGLRYQDTLGTAHPSAYTVISTDAIDAYFLLGGVPFAGAAIPRPRRTERDQAQIG